MWSGHQVPGATIARLRQRRSDDGSVVRGIRSVDGIAGDRGLFHDVDLVFVAGTEVDVVDALIDQFRSCLQWCGRMR